jgi:hypothetical protein
MRQSDSRALKFISAMEALKHAEQPMRLFHAKSRAVVPDVVDHFARACGGADVDHGRRVLSAVF